MNSLEPEILVNISLRLPQADRGALAAHLTELMAAAVAVGGHTTHIALQPYTPADDD